jgi:hypothetical protein
MFSSAEAELLGNFYYTERLCISASGLFSRVIETCFNIGADRCQLCSLVDVVELIELIVYAFCVGVVFLRYYILRVSLPFHVVMEVSLQIQDY